jgi:hypothetical protein
MMSSLLANRSQSAPKEQNLVETKAENSLLENEMNLSAGRSKAIAHKHVFIPIMCCVGWHYNPMIR